MMEFNKNKRIQQVIFYLLVGVSLLIALTPFYGFGYLLFIFVASARFNFIKALDTRFANFIGCLLLFMASIMVTGVFTSYLQISNFPIINIAVALLFFSVIWYVQPGNKQELRMFNAADGIALFASMLVPICLLGVHLTSGVDAGLFRIVNQDGWDNTSHLNLLQTVEENKNYFYSTSPLRNAEGRIAYNNYPQGWHIASVNMVDGFVPSAFNPKSHSIRTTLIAYIGVTFLWYFLAVYILFKSVWWLAGGGNRIGRMSAWALFVILQVPIIALFMPSLFGGYINYLGIVPYLVLAGILSYQVATSSSRKHNLVYCAIMAMLIAGVALIWVLPVIALGLMAIMVLMNNGINKAVDFTKKALPILAMAAVLLAALLGYAVVLIHDVAISHISVGGWIPQFPTTLFTFLLLVVAVAGVIRGLIKSQGVVVVLLPFVLYSFALWLFAYLKEGELGYYHAKVFGLFFIVIVLFAAPVLAKLIDVAFSSDAGLKKMGLPLKIVMPVMLAASLFIFSGQGMNLAPLQRNSYYISQKESKYISDWINQKDYLSGNGQLLLMSENFFRNQNKAMLFNRLSRESAEVFLASSSPSLKNSFDKKDTCLMRYLYDEDSNRATLDAAKESLSNCLKVRSENGLKTTILLPRGAEATLENVTLYNTKLEYYTIDK